MMTSLYGMILLVVAACRPTVAGNEENPFTTPDIITKYGYPVETHTVTTEDGYLLTVHRIPGSPRAASSGVKTPVLLQHGLGMASDSWVLTGPERGLGFLLADQGYDVWMNNARGNLYSKKHSSISSFDYRYSNYTWHEMGVYDLPAVIDHILETTNQKQLFYIGHSMGGTMFYVLTSMRPEYNQKIRLGVTMAPAVFLWKPKSMLSSGFQLSHSLYRSFVKAKMSSLGLNVGQKIMKMISSFCSDDRPFQEFCTECYHATLGRSEKELNTTLLPSIIAHSISGYNPKILDHYKQLVETEKFQMYSEDGISKPLEYNLSQVTAPVSVHYALNDALVTPEGVVHLSKNLPNLASLVRVPEDNANHADFIYAIHAKQLFYDDVLKLMEKY